MSNIPTTMRSLVAPKKCTPADYQVVDAPTPKITEPGQVLLRMRAVGINTGDTQFARGVFDMIEKQEYVFHQPAASIVTATLNLPTLRIQS